MDQPVHKVKSIDRNFRVKKKKRIFQMRTITGCLGLDAV